jgi:hypothetical protein
MPLTLETIFCDDIRHEINGKISYIGVYSERLFVKPLPAKLPKLCLAVRAVIPVGTPINSLVVRVYKDEIQFAESRADEKDFREAEKNLRNEGTDNKLSWKPEKVFIYRFFFIFAPFEINEPCIIRVRGLFGNEELKGVALNIGLAS